MNDFFTHAKAIIDPGAKIGKNSRIWAYAHVQSGATIGSDCNIGNYAFVESGATLGNNVTVKNGVQVWEGIIAEDDVFLGPNCVLTNDMWPRSGQKRDKASWLLKTHLKKGATICANVIICPGITIGEYAFIGAGSVVTKDVPAYALIYGNPARQNGWVSKTCKRVNSQSEAAQSE